MYLFDFLSGLLRFEIEIEPIFATMALYDLKEKKKVKNKMLSSIELNIYFIVNLMLSDDFICLSDIEHNIHHNHAVMWIKLCLFVISISDKIKMIFLARCKVLMSYWWNIVYLLLKEIKCELFDTFPSIVVSDFVWLVIMMLQCGCASLDIMRDQLNLQVCFNIIILSYFSVSKDCRVGFWYFLKWAGFYPSASLSCRCLSVLCGFIQLGGFHFLSKRTGKIKCRELYQIRFYLLGLPPTVSPAFMFSSLLERLMALRYSPG